MKQTFEPELDFETKRKGLLKLECYEELCSGFN